MNSNKLNKEYNIQYYIDACLRPQPIPIFSKGHNF